MCVCMGDGGGGGGGAMENSDGKKSYTTFLKIKI